MPSAFEGEEGSGWQQLLSPQDHKGDAADLADKMLSSFSRLLTNLSKAGHELRCKGLTG